MNPPSVSRPHFFGLLAGLALAAGLVFASLVVAGAWTRISESQVINVTGSAHKNVRSDLVVWRSNFSVDAPTLLEAQQKLSGDLGKVTAFLTARGFTEFTALPAQIRDITAREHNREDDTTTSVRVGYHLTQNIELRSGEVERVPRLAGESGELLQQGVTFVSDGFEFIYTRASDAKVEMMADATRDARARAEQIAAQGGRKIKELRSARMGVVQINPLYSSSTSWEGNNDTAALEKTITATIGATFSLN
jgi:hypothetical protein